MLKQKFYKFGYLSHPQQHPIAKSKWQISSFLLPCERSNGTIWQQCKYWHSTSLTFPVQCDKTCFDKMRMSHPQRIFLVVSIFFKLIISIKINFHRYELGTHWSLLCSQLLNISVQFTHKRVFILINRSWFLQKVQKTVKKVICAMHTSFYKDDISTGCRICRIGFFMLMLTILDTICQWLFS